MKNIDVIERFVNGGTKGKTANLFIEDNKLFNYNTCIAERNDSNESFVVNATKYSMSTTTIQNQLLRALAHDDITVLADIPMGTQSLI